MCTEVPIMYCRIFQNWFLVFIVYIFVKIMISLEMKWKIFFGHDESVNLSRQTCLYETSVLRNREADQIVSLMNQLTRSRTLVTILLMERQSYVYPMTSSYSTFASTATPVHSHKSDVNEIEIRRMLEMDQLLVVQSLPSVK